MSRRDVGDGFASSGYYSVDKENSTSSLERANGVLESEKVDLPGKTRRRSVLGNSGCFRWPEKRGSL
jgi:hypothetical protein